MEYVEQIEVSEEKSHCFEESGTGQASFDFRFFILPETDPKEEVKFPLS